MRVKPFPGSSAELTMPGGVWSGIVVGLAVLAAGGGVVERLPPQAISSLEYIAYRLGHAAERLSQDSLRLEYVGGRAGGEYVINIGCSLDYAVLVGIASGVLAPPGATVILRGCEELVEADWRPLVEVVAVYGGRAYPAGSPRSLVVIEAVGRGRLRTGLWRIQARSDSTVAHITGAIIAALAAETRAYIIVWPRDPPAKSDIDPAVYAASVLGGIEYSPAYNRFRVEPGAPGARIVNYPDASLALHLAGLAAFGRSVTLRAWGLSTETPYSPLAVARTLLEQLGYTAEVSGGDIRVTGLGEQVRRLFWLRDNPEYAPSIVTLAAARRGEARLEELPESYAREASDVASIYVQLGYQLETGGEYLSIRPGGEALITEELVATCTNPHVLPATIIASMLASRSFIVERGECLKSVWPGFYQELGESIALESV